MAISFKRKTALMIRLFLAAGLLSSLAACDKPDTQAAKLGTASFQVEKASGYGELVQADPKSKWKVPGSVLFSFQACLKDRANGTSLRGHRFNVERVEDGVTFTPDEASDINGCIKWSEDIAFNYYAKKSVRLPVNRMIVGQGINSGKAEVKFVINPWAVGSKSRDRGDAVIFLRDQILPEGQVASLSSVQTALSGDMSGRAGLWIPNVDITNIRRQSFTDGSIVDLTFSLKPKIVVTDMNGEEIYKEIDSGEFDIIAHLIATDTGLSQKEKLLISTNDIAGSGRVRDGELVITARTSLERRVSRGNLQLAIKLLPRGIGSLSSLKPYEGIFELGDFNNLSRGPNGILADICRRDDAASECTVAQALAQTDNWKKLEAEGFAYKNDPFIFSNLKLRFNSVQPGETATQRTVLYTASTCITDRHNARSADDLPFTVEYLDEKGGLIPVKTKDKKTNEEGCLTWDSTIFHKYYQPERLFWQDVRISFGDKKKPVVRNLRFAINPWDDKFTFGWDARDFSPEFIKTIQERNKIPSRFYLSNYGYHTVRFLYNIDKFMELEVKKTVLVELDPVVLRYSGIVNARKQTESLRDGIYLMKVGIQKDYLDPADPAHKIENKREAVPAMEIDELGGSVSRKEYVTTQSQLVRVVDGKINHPVELTMRDLRLMRIRANFVIQLETVDERKVIADDELRKQFKNDLEGIEKKRATLGAMLPEERNAKIQSLKLERKKKLEDAYFLLQDKLDDKGTSLAELNLTIDPDILNPLKRALDTADFTGTKFVLSDKKNLNDFLEKDSGLDRRTFVGPVIFLSNAFGDAVRATDNLDEACRPENAASTTAEADLPVGAISYPKDTPVIIPSEDLTKKRSDFTKDIEGELSNAEQKEDFKGHELELFVDALRDDNVTSKRSNNAYRFSRYFGSLSHLCSKNVDDLIDREKEIADFNKVNMPIYASIYNFVSLYNLEFLTLGKEKLTKLDMECPVFSGKCLHETDEKTLPLAKVVSMINGHRGSETVNPRTPSPPAHITMKTHPNDYSAEEISGMLFGNLENPHTQFGLCRVLAARAAERINTISKDERYAGFFTRMRGKLIDNEASIRKNLFEGCISQMTDDQKPVFLEDRLRVHETGKYTFLGGLQLNLNVGENMSVSRGDSWGYGFEPLDVLSGPLAFGGALIGGMLGGGIPGAAMGATIGTLAGSAATVLKPISLKSGTSLGNSNGTSISLSTYIVSQIARFNLQINEYEHCRIVRFDPTYAISAANDLGLDQKFQEVLARGLFVCMGTTTKKPTNVEESYFYFTQHFTEGDMLDQADIYNNPWLLGLRGVREFATLLDVTRAQEEVSLYNLTEGYWSPKNRELGWPLTHLATTYRKMLPTFPGLYTVVRDEEKLTIYPFSKRFTSIDRDLNSEATCRLNGDGVCTPKAPYKGPLSKADIAIQKKAIYGPGSQAPE